MADIDHLICDTAEEASWVLSAIHRLSELADGLAVPYTTPLRKEDRRGPDDGSTVTIQAFTRPRRLVDGKIVIGLTPNVRKLIAIAKDHTAAQMGVTATRRTRLLALLSAKRVVTKAEVSDDQTGLEVTHVRQILPR